MSLGHANDFPEISALKTRYGSDWNGTKSECSKKTKTYEHDNNESANVITWNSLLNLERKTVHVFRGSVNYALEICWHFMSWKACWFEKWMCASELPCWHITIVVIVYQIHRLNWINKARRRRTNGKCCMYVMWLNSPSDLEFLTKYT